MQGSNVNIYSGDPTLAPSTPTRDAITESELGSEDPRATTDVGSTMTRPQTPTVHPAIDRYIDLGSLDDTISRHGYPTPLPLHDESQILFEDIDLEDLSGLVQLSDLRESMEFIRALENARLDDQFSKLSSALINRLRDPPTYPVDIDNPDLRFGLDLFISVINSPQETYTSAREAVLRRHPDDQIPTYHQIKHSITEITGVESIENDMCIKTCLAYTGPFINLEHCPVCGEARWDPVTRKARQTFHTVPVGPQLQALWGDKDSAQRMKYRRDLNVKLAELLSGDGAAASFPTFDDYFYGSDYIEAVRDGRIQENDMVLMLSFDGAQLYQYKQSDCWIYIMDHYGSCTRDSLQKETCPSWRSYPRPQ